MTGVFLYLFGLLLLLVIVMLVLFRTIAREKAARKKATGTRERDRGRHGVPRAPRP